MSNSQALITEQTLNWVRFFIIEYNLCPFAKSPVNKGTLRIKVSNVRKKKQALEEFMSEIYLLNDNPNIETTLLVFAHAFKDFFTYLDFVDLAERLINEQGYEGIYQVATFHPDYYFAETDLDDVSNYTNRSLYPMVHLLREESLEKAISFYGHTDIIPEHNIATMNHLGCEKIKNILQHCLKEC